MKTAVITLRKNKSHSVLRQHPWVFSGAIVEEVKDSNGDFALLQTEKKEIIASGFIQHGSIIFKVLSFSRVADLGALIRERVKTAVDRRKLHILNDDTDACRLIYGEGDQLPGLIVDLYGSSLVIEAHAVFWVNYIDLVQKALEQCLSPNQVYLIDKHDKSNPSKRLISGEEGNVIIKENSCIFEVNILEGQKTGFFLDQRDNRKKIAVLLAGKKVLNTFSYTGGFSVYAAKNGANVTSVDSSAPAISQLSKNMALNNIQHHEAFTADVFDFLKTCDAYDAIIVDPPAFAKHVRSRHQAVKGYKRLNSMALNKINPGGLLITFSCSQVIDRKLFEDTVISSFFETGKTGKLISRLGHGLDHPVITTFPEGEYLKGLIFEVA